MMEPLANYRERGPNGLRREFYLYADRVSILGKRRLQSEYQTHVPLATLDPSIGILTWRGPGLIKGIGWTIGSASGLVVTVQHYGLPLDSLLALLALASTIAGLAVVAVNIRTYKAYRFVNASGLTVLDMIEAGPEKDRCEAFANEVSAAIRAIKSPLPTA